MRILLILFILYMAGCSQKTQQEDLKAATPPDTATVVTEGQKITQAAFKSLSSNLQQALAKGGVQHALQFCNIEAMPLTDSLSSNYGVRLGRASHRPRNPANRADSLEMATIREYLSRIQKQKELKPFVFAEAEQIIYHAPIRINNPLCLNCHGNVGTDISESDARTIQQLYPQDQATEFAMGDLRGIWTVTFPPYYFENTVDSN